VERGRTVTLKEGSMSISGSIVASGVVLVIMGDVGKGLIVTGVGIATFLVTYFFIRQPPAPFQASSPPVNQQDVKQEASPHIHAPINISVVGSTSTASAAAPTSVPEPRLNKKPEPRCNIKFKDVSIGQRTPDGPFPQFRPPYPFCAAIFENELIDGCEPLIPTVKARVTFKHPDGHKVRDLSDVAWIPGTGKTWETFDVNTPRYLNLFTLKDGHLFCRIVEFIGIPIGRRNRGSIWRDIPIMERIASVEIQLLTKTDRQYGVILDFEDTGNGMPRFAGSFREF